MNSSPAPSLALPETLPDIGLLIGWSTELDRRRVPFGFGFGDPAQSPATGYVDPILMEGEGHVITVAPTGAGKGTGCIVPALLRFPGPVIVIDPKGENVAITARRRREMGQQVIVIDPMGLTEHESGSINPLDLIDIKSDMAVDDAASVVASMTLPGLGKDSSDGGYWSERGQQMVLGIVLHVLADRPCEDRHLGTVRRLINKMTSELGWYNAAAEGQPGSLEGTILETLEQSNHPEARAIGAMLRIGASSTVGGFTSFAQSIVDFVRAGPIERSLRTSSFDLDAVTRGDPLSIYLVLPPHMLDSHGRVLRLWVNSLLSLVTRRRGRPKLPTLFILDEAAQLGAFDPLRRAITLMRGYGLQTWSLWQDASQLRELYPRDWQSMVNNCRAIQCFGPNTMLAAKAMGDLVGYDDTASLLDMDDNEMLLQISGDIAVMARLPDYRTDPAFAGQFDLNPFHDPDRMPVEPRLMRRVFTRDPAAAETIRRTTFLVTGD